MLMIRKARTEERNGYLGPARVLTFACAETQKPGAKRSARGVSFIIITGVGLIYPSISSFFSIRSMNRAEFRMIEER